MSKRAWTIAWVGVAVAALLLLVFTVLNRSWWARRINARWSIMGISQADADAPAGFDKPTFERIVFDDSQARNYGLAELARLYFEGGGQNWTRK
jgi:hypothetical protein